MSPFKNFMPVIGFSCLLVLPTTVQAGNWSTTTTGNYEIKEDNIRVPFKIVTGTPTDSVFIDSTGNVGLGTNTPGGGFNARLHIADPTPEIVLDTGTQIWDVFANNGGFGFTDETSATLPFFIEKGAPSGAFLIESSGYVGLGIQDPTSKLHMSGDSANEEDVQILVQNFNTANPGIARKLFVIKNDGPAKFSIWGSATDEWAFNGRPDEFRISKQGSGLVEMEVQTGGNMVIKGTLTQGSSRLTKNRIEPVEAQEVLAKVVSLPISEWTYNHDDKGVRHLGPMSEDFFQAFGLGASDEGLTSIDTSGVALAAIKGLHERLEDKDTEIRALRAQLQDTKAHQDERILQLELMLSEMIRQKSSVIHVSIAD